MTAARATALLAALEAAGLPSTHSVTDGVHTVEVRLVTGRDLDVDALGRIAAAEGVTWRVSGAPTLQAITEE